MPPKSVLEKLRPVVAQAETQIILMVGMLALVVFVALGFHRQAELRRIHRLFFAQVTEESAMFDKVVGLMGTSLETFARDYTYWDELVRFVRTRDPDWARQNLAAPLESYRADAVWVFDTTGVLLYSAGAEGHSAPVEAVLAPLRQGRRFVHCFLWTAHGPLELRGATIHPTSDPDRRTSPQGVLFVGRLWDADFVRELSELVGGRVRVVAGPAGSHGPHLSHPEQGVMFIVHDLPGPDGSAVAHVGFEKRVYAVGEFLSASNRQFFMMGAFAAAVMFTVALALVVLVGRRMSYLNRAMTEERPELLHRLQKSHSEFGRLARLVVAFFEQREELARYRGHLEELVERRTRELNAAYVKLVQKERLAALGQVAGGVAHEIRNPLAAIANAAYYLKRKVVAEPGSRVERHLGIIEEQIAHANEVITRLLDFARGSTPEAQRLDVAELVAEALGQAQLPKTVRVEKKLDAGLAVRADRRQMVQVLVNLLTNASQAMEGKGRIVVRAAKENGGVAIRVIDSGPGIASEHLARVFEPLYSTKAVGVGLGLAISRNFVQANQGRIELQSEPGSGATAVVRLPAAAGVER
jgi:signal transduction histidine kinase